MLFKKRIFIQRDSIKKRFYVKGLQMFSPVQFLHDHNIYITIIGLFKNFTFICINNWRTIFENYFVFFLITIKNVLKVTSFVLVEQYNK